jgi:hypothetical protein
MSKFIKYSHKINISEKYSNIIKELQILSHEIRLDVFIFEINKFNF